MSFLNHDHALIRGLLVGAVVLASASACSRSDRTETGTNNTGTGTIVADSVNTQDQNNAVMPPSGDTAVAVNTDTNRATGTANAPRAETAPPSTESASKPDTATAGYREMERDSSTTEMAAPRDSARVTADSAVAPAEQSSVTPSDSAPMEVATPTSEDTSAVATPEAAAVAADSSVEMAGAVQDSVADSATAYSETTSATITTDSAPIEQSDTTMAAGQVEMATQENFDSAGAVDTAVASSDTTVGVGDSAHVARTGDRLDPVVASAEVNDTLTETEGTPVRPPEDSTEVYGNVTETDAAENQAMKQEDRETNEVGAAAIGGNVNGADAVALMTRQGIQCIVVDPESAKGAEVDMSDTPATLNPCGLGSMVLTRIWTKQE